METNLPSLTRYYSLNRVGRPVNNLDLVNRNNAVNQRHNVYATMGHRGGNVRIIAPPDQEMFHTRGESGGSPGDNYEATYNVSSTSDYNIGSNLFWSWSKFFRSLRLPQISPTTL